MLVSNGIKKNARINLAFLVEARLEIDENEKNLAICLTTAKVLFQRL